MWYPPRTSLRLIKVVIHRQNLLLQLTAAPLVFSVVAEYQPEEIRTGENGTRGFPTGIILLQDSKRQSGERKSVLNT